MAVIKEYQANVGTPDARSGRVAVRPKTTDYNVAPVQDPRGQALANAGRVVAEIGIDLEARARKKREDANKAKALAMMSDFELRMEQDFERARNEAPLDAPDFTPQFVEAYDGAADALITEDLDEGLKAMLKESTLRMRSRFINDAINFESRASAEAKRIELGQAADNLGQVSYMRPNMVESSIAQFSSVVESMDLPAAEKKAILLSGQQKIALSGATKLSEIMPEKVVEELSKDKVPQWAKHLDVTQIEQIRSRAERRLEQGKATETFAINRRYEDAIASYTMYGDAADVPTADELKMANGQEKGAFQAQRLDLARRLGQDVQLVKTMTPDQIAKLVNDRVPKPGDSDFEGRQQAFNTLTSAIQTRNTQLVKDPAAYVLGAIPEVLQSHNDMLLAMTDEDSTRRHEAVQNYSMQMSAAQTRLGVTQPKLLSDNMKSQMILNLTTSGQNPDGTYNPELSIGAKVKKAKETWGNFWPQVYGEVAEKLPGSINVVASTPDEYARGVLSRMLTTDDAKVFAGLPTGVTQKQIQDTVTSDATFRDFVLSLSYQVGGQSVVADYQKEITRLAGVYVKQGNGSVTQAVKNAMDSVIGKAYSYIDDKSFGGMLTRLPRQVNVNLRVPKQELPDMVEKGLRPSLEMAINDGVYLMTDFGGMARDTDEQRELSTKRVRESHFWQPTENEDGAVLMIMDDFAVPKPVFNKNGQVVRFKWADIRANGASVPVAADLMEVLNPNYESKNRELLKRKFEELRTDEEAPRPEAPSVGKRIF